MSWVDISARLYGNGYTLCVFIVAESSHVGIYLLLELMLLVSIGLAS